jgi:hypothetical protein
MNAEVMAGFKAALLATGTVVTALLSNAVLAQELRSIGWRTSCCCNFPFRLSST